MSLDKLKLNKRLHASMLELGHYTAKEFQIQSLSRIIGGHDILGIAPVGAGKTTTYILGSLMRLKPSKDEAPKILVLTPDETRVPEIVEQFITISRNPDLHIMGLQETKDIEEEVDELSLGLDIVVATPPRARAVYLKLGLNLNHIQTFIVDDAEEMVKKGMQTRVRELAQSCGNVQYLAFATVEDKKLHQMIDPFMPLATLIEVDEQEDQKAETHELLVYQLTDTDAKLKHLHNLLEDEDVFDKAVLFVNTRLSAHQLSEQLQLSKGKIAVLHPLLHVDTAIETIQDFKHNPQYRLLILASESEDKLDLRGIPFIIHYEIPEDIVVFVQHILKKSADEAMAITLATSTELPQIKKIEEFLEQEIPVVVINP